MGIFDFFKKGNKKAEIIEDNSAMEAKSNNYYDDTPRYNSVVYPILPRSFDGEKTLGELGIVTHTVPDYLRIRLRAYDAEMKTDLVKIITDRFFEWVVGSGLKLQSEPNEEVLSIFGIQEDFNAFKKNTESLYSVYAKSKYSDFSRMNNLDQKSLECYKTAKLGGDCLVVCRIENNNLNVQIIDGIHLSNPEDYETIKVIEDAGNTIKHGVEINKKGEHIAYHMKKIDGTTEKISVYGQKSKRKLAWLVYGNKQRIDHIRGISSISQSLEKIAKLDRYTEASVGKAEQAAKIAYTIEHNNYSTGEGIIEKTVQQKMKVLGEVQDGYALGNTLAQKITETTSNQAFNMPVGAKMSAFGTSIETDFDKFYMAVINTLCSGVGVPPEVAMQMYNSNYSASRAAINAFGYKVDLEREKHAEDFYKPIYKLFLEVEVLKNNISANGFIKALQDDNFMIVEAYTSCRFIGKNMPHIDPLKEIKAIREMLGSEKDGITPLISHEQATEMLNQGDWNANYRKYLEEDKKIVKPEIPNQNGIN